MLRRMLLFFNLFITSFSVLEALVHFGCKMYLKKLLSKDTIFELSEAIRYTDNLERSPHVGGAETPVVE